MNNSIKQEYHWDNKEIIEKKVKIKKEKFRKLSIIALIAGMLPFTLLPLVFLEIDFIENYFGLDPNWPFIWKFQILFALSFFIIFLSIPAIVCGSIDLNRIIAGLYSKKGIGFDSTGIIIGVVFIFSAFLFPIFIFAPGDF